MTRLRVRLLNDYALIVAGLRAMLAPFGDRIEIVEVDLQDTADRQVDLTLFDTFGQEQVHRPEIDKYLNDAQAGALVVYSWNTAPALVAIALEKGCRGYLGKSASPEEIVAALERIGEGDIVVHQSDSHEDDAHHGDARPSDAARSEGANQLTTQNDSSRGGAEHAEHPEHLEYAEHLDPPEHPEHPEHPEPPAHAAAALQWPGKHAGLTLLEAEVVALITQGYTNPEIADLCFISGNTLKSRIRSAYRKIGVERRSQAVRWGIEHDMLPPRSAPSGH